MNITIQSASVDDKLSCPACSSAKTKCSKVVERAFKDILWENSQDKEGKKKGFRVFDLSFYQRYLRCDGCNNNVFLEHIVFSDKSGFFPAEAFISGREGGCGLQSIRILPANTAAVRCLDLTRKKNCLRCECGSICTQTKK